MIFIAKKKRSLFIIEKERFFFFRIGAPKIQPFGGVYTSFKDGDNHYSFQYNLCRKIIR